MAKSVVGWAFLVAIVAIGCFPSNAVATNTCGQLTEPCCVDSCPSPMIALCFESSVCDPATFTCVACGGLGQPCCLTEDTTSAIASCNAGLTCVGITSTINGTCRGPTAPALSASGLAATALLLVLAGWWGIYRRRRHMPI